MKRTLFKRAELGPVGVTPCALGENKDVLPLSLHLLGRALECLEGIGPVAPVDEHRARERHEPAQKGDPLEARLGGDGGVRREDGAEEQHVQLGLVVTDDDARPPRVEIFFPRDELESHPSGQVHGEFEGPSGQVLGDSVPAERPKNDGGENAVDSASDEAGVRAEKPGEEGRTGNTHG